jgi:hypothetical protein
MEISTNLILILIFALLFVLVAKTYETFNNKNLIRTGIVIIIINSLLTLNLLLNLINLIN